MMPSSAPWTASMIASAEVRSRIGWLVVPAVTSWSSSSGASSRRPVSVTPARAVLICSGAPVAGIVSSTRSVAPRPKCNAAVRFGSAIALTPAPRVIAATSASTTRAPSTGDPVGASSVSEIAGRSTGPVAATSVLIRSRTRPVNPPAATVNPSGLASRPVPSTAPPLSSPDSSVHHARTDVSLAATLRAQSAMAGSPRASRSSSGRPGRSSESATPSIASRCRVVPSADPACALMSPASSSTASVPSCCGSLIDTSWGDSSPMRNPLSAKANVGWLPSVGITVSREAPVSATCGSLNKPPAAATDAPTRTAPSGEPARNSAAAPGRVRISGKATVTALSRPAVLDATRAASDSRTSSSASRITRYRPREGAALAAIGSQLSSGGTPRRSVSSALAVPRAPRASPSSASRCSVSVSIDRRCPPGSENHASLTLTPSSVRCSRPTATPRSMSSSATGGAMAVTSPRRARSRAGPAA